MVPQHHGFDCVCFGAQWLAEWLALQKVPQVSKAVSPALPLLQAGAVAACVRAGARSRSSEVARAKSILPNPPKFVASDLPPLGPAPLYLSHFAAWLRAEHGTNLHFCSL